MYGRFWYPIHLFLSTFQDNVVRAGLTPKPKDKDTLCSMLTYKDGPPTVLKGKR